MSGAELAAANYIESFVGLSDVTSGGRWHRGDGLVLTALPVEAAAWNACFVTDAVTDARAVVDACREFFGSSPYSLRVPVALADPFGDAGADLGIDWVMNFPAMNLDVAAVGIPRPPGDLDIRDVHDCAEIEEFLAANAAGFGAPPEMLAAALRAGITHAPNIVAFSGTCDGRVVATSIVVVAAGAAGVYGVATVPEYRRRGFGEALTWAAVEAGVARGCDVATLQSSDSGRSVYERMGFRVVLEYRRFDAPAQRA
ncbi:MAG TPA: GNAT family N-acetyltransferase [Acidimicrobiia bacterium]|nr:GNAT family N-acetyltransferase [Acidimicrobiia bacterium]